MMPRIRKTLKIAVTSLLVIILIAGVLWYPYKSGTVPEWRIQVIDFEGRPVVGMQVEQEWLDPIDDGMTFEESSQTDTQGFVVFPRRPLHNRLAFGRPPYQPSAHIYMCGQGQYGQASWDAKHNVMVTRVELKKGACPFG
jgi:hypothetical protein